MLNIFPKLAQLFSKKKSLGIRLSFFASLELSLVVFHKSSWVSIGASWHYMKTSLYSRLDFFIPQNVCVVQKSLLVLREIFLASHLRLVFQNDNSFLVFRKIFFVLHSCFFVFHKSFLTSIIDQCNFVVFKN